MAPRLFSLLFSHRSLTPYKVAATLKFSLSRVPPPVFFRKSHAKTDDSISLRRRTDAEVNDARRRCDDWTGLMKFKE